MAGKRGTNKKGENVFSDRDDLTSTLQISVVPTLEKLLLLLILRLLLALGSLGLLVIASTLPPSLPPSSRLESRHSICSRPMELESSVDRGEMGKGGFGVREGG